MCRKNMTSQPPLPPASRQSVSSRIPLPGNNGEKNLNISSLFLLVIEKFKRWKAAKDTTRKSGATAEDRQGGVQQENQSANHMVGGGAWDWLAGWLATK